jgi:hypothetical protein
LFFAFFYYNLANRNHNINHNNNNNPEHLQNNTQNVNQNIIPPNQNPHQNIELAQQGRLLLENNELHNI